MSRPKQKKCIELKGVEAENIVGRVNNIYLHNEEAYEVDNKESGSSKEGLLE